MRRKFWNTGEWEMEVMKDSSLEGVSEQEAVKWLGISEQDLHRLIEEGILEVYDVYDGKGGLVKSLVRAMDIRKLLSQRKGSKA